MFLENSGERKLGVNKPGFDLKRNDEHSHNEVRCRNTNTNKLALTYARLVPRPIQIPSVYAHRPNKDKDS